MATDKLENVTINVVDTKECSVILNIEVAQPEVAGETEKVFKDIQRVAQVPGFRQGKAPLELVKKNYSSSARERVIENLIQRTAFPSLEKQGVEPVASPQIEEVSFDFEKPFSYRLKAEKNPEFAVKGYKDIKVKKEVQDVTDAKVKENLEALRERNARLEASKSDAVGDASFVMADYEGSFNGENIPELKAKNQLVDLSAPQSLAGLKEGLAGTKKGEERTIKVKFPEDSPNKKLAGKDVDLTVKVLEIKDKVLPALDDEFAKDLGLSSLQELETKIRESLQAEEKKRQDREVEKQLVDALLQSNTFCVPESHVEDQLKYLLGRMAEYYRRQGMPDSAWEKNVPQWREKYREEAERNVRLSYILNAVAKEEKIEVTDEDLSREREDLKKANPGKEADVEKYFEENKGSIASRMKEEKIFKFLLDHAKVKEEVKK